MVMKRNAMRRNLRQSILKSLGRYIAIVAIIALGSALFVGLLMTKSDMIATGQKFMDEQNMFDIRMMSSFGWSDEQLEYAIGMDGISAGEGVFYTDLIAQYGEDTDDAVYRFYAMPKSMNMPDLRGGRMPENNTECLVDGFYADDSILGTRITVSENNDEDAMDVLKEKAFTVVGYIASPLYMDMNRGTTSIGSGTLSGYVYLPRGCVDADYYSEIHLTIPGDYDVYSDAYNAKLDEMLDLLEPEAEKLCRERFDSVKAEAEAEYQDGYQEFQDGVLEYEDGKAEAEQELADAYQELIDGEKEIEDNQYKLEQAEYELIMGQATLDQKQAEISSGWAALPAAKADAYAQYEAGKAQLEGAISLYFGSVENLNAAYESIQTAENMIAELEDQLKDPSKTEQEKRLIQGQIDYIKGQLGDVSQVKELYHGYQSLPGQKAAIESEFAKVEKQLSDGQDQIDEARGQIKANITKVYDGYKELEEARIEIKDGWKEYYEAKEEVEQELADALRELQDAEAELADAREEIDSLEYMEVILLDRRSNVGYNNLYSAASIVQGVSRVLPIFFLLIASLVCITTMTRMIDEERTQIGTLKALGYSNLAIISKYLIYAGSGAVIGCGLGVFAGSSILPMTLWEAYKIMLYIDPKMVLTVNWGLCIVIIAVYTAIMLMVTWYCCHKTLEEVPAELIRPKAPDAGKALFVEKLPFWNRIGFLNKVMIRNIFRYRQRLAMMLVGIGGCTALLVTGFGLRDSIVNVVDFQFENVTVYDLSVYFREEQTLTEQLLFRQELGDLAEDVMFYHQSSMDIEFDNVAKEIYMISSDDKLTRFIDMHVNDQAIPMPGPNEVVLSIGVSEMMGIEVGDQLTMRNPDMQVLELTVSGIYENHIDNFAIVSPETIEEQWNEKPEKQMAFVKVAEDQEPFQVSTTILEMDDVMNVSVSEDLAGMIGNMMDALDLVIVVVVVSAGMLAVIVLYNLTNININERIREIATIKVLGFNASETGAYVFKENMALTVVGSILGLGLGYLMLLFVMSQVKIDMVWFKTTVMPQSYVISAVLTLLSAVVVDFVFYFKLQKINMAEALKSVE